MTASATPATAPLEGAVPRGRAAMLLGSDRLVLAFLTGLAALLRLPGLEGRGIFDADQGRDMLVIYNLVKHGDVPLLGPETISIADSHLHHGAFYWYLFAPAAWLTGGNPFAVVFEGALIGIAAVIATWWAGRVMGGPAVGAIAGLLIAVSPAAVEQSIFLWNPNPVPLFAALALGGAWQGHRTGRGRWYVLAIGSAVAVYQLHLLGAAFVVAIGALIAYDLARALRWDRSRLRGMIRGIAGGLLVTVGLFMPLIVNEAETGFQETGRILQFLAHGGSTPTLGGLDPLPAFVFIVFRSIGWPFVGQVIEAPLAAVLAVAIWLALVTWWLARARGEERLLILWLAGTVAFSTITLDRMAPWLRFVVPGFPTDHYHAFLNPVLVIAVALAAVGLSRRAAGGLTRGPAERSAAGGGGASAAGGAGAAPRGLAGGSVGVRVLQLALVVALVGEVIVSVARQPGPSTVATWPVAQAVGQQIVDLAAGRSMALVPLPYYKSPDSIGYPIVYLGGRTVEDPTLADLLVVNCDARFDQFLVGGCGGPAEDGEARSVLVATGATPILVRRFDESTALRVSVYEVKRP